MNDILWSKIKQEYVTSNIGYRELCKKHRVSLSTMADRGRKDNWVKDRKAYRKRVETKTLQKTADLEAKENVSRLKRIGDVADKLLKKIDEAVDQLNNYVVTNKTKTKTVEYNNKANKPTKEVVKETEDKAIVAGDVDRLGLEKVASALKSVKEVLSTTEQDDDIGQFESLVKGLANNVHEKTE